MSTMTINSVVKMIAVSPLAIAATFGLVLLMYSLVTRDFVEPPIIVDPVIPAIVMEKVGPITEIQDAPKPPEAVEPPPEIKIEPKVDKMDVAVADLISRDVSTDNATDGIGMGDGALMPFYRVPPSYPSRAVTRGVEGYVDLIFDVTATGTTTNIRVTYAQPKGYFERAAKRAIQRWKYKPQVMDGVPQAARGQTTRLEFKIEK